MKIYAYRVEQRGPRALGTVLDRIYALPLEDRFFGDMGIRLEDKGVRGGFIMMDFAKERTGHGPGRMHRRHPIQDIQLGNGENFAEDTGVAYCPQTGYAALQYNHIGPRAGLIERYLRAADLSFGQIRARQEGEHDEDVAGFIFANTFTRDAYARMRRFGIYREVEFTVSVPGVVPEDLPQGRSLTSVLRSPLPAGIESLTIKMNATPHDRDSSLGGGAVREILNDLRQLGDTVVRASVRGKRGHGERVEEIDLKAEQVSDWAEVTAGPTGRFSKNDRWAALAATLHNWIDSGTVRT